MARPRKQTAEPAPENKPYSDVVKPMIRANGERHVLEVIFDGDPDDMPVVKSVGYMPVKEGSSGWISYTITSRGREIISIEVDEPNIRPIAEENAKMAFVTAFIDQEF